MALEDIERLKERVNKDPNSKLFVPLAEEYKKAGMIDEAILVLINGLERHPGYMSARVSLGKIYLEKGMIENAKIEFEKVTSFIPDNLYAHRKLAEIYKDLGKKDKALEEFKKVLRLNPSDEWAFKNLSDIEGKSLDQPVQEAIKEEETVSVGTERLTEEEKPLSAVSEKEIEDFKKALFKEKGEVSEEVLLSEDIEEVPGEIYEKAHLGLADADACISQGKYAEAMNIYRKILSSELGNIHILQRMEELKALLKLLGKDNEELIARLNSFLENIKKRSDEYFRRL
ncbi:MAG: tetratricopeptide repeat protein [Nitrospirota bacterium]